MQPFWVYVLECADGSYYVGHTDDLELRMAQHRAAEVPGYTRDRLPVKLAYCAEFPSRDDAIRRERQIKGWSRSKKKALVEHRWSDLRTLARGPLRKRRRA